MQLLSTEYLVLTAKNDRGDLDVNVGYPFASCGSVSSLLANQGYQNVPRGRSALNKGDYGLRGPELFKTKHTQTTQYLTLLLIYFS